MVALVHDAFEKAKKLTHLTQEAAAKRLGVNQRTVGRWRKREKAPRKKQRKVTVEALGLRRNEGKRAPVCGHPAELITLDGHCPECKLLELIRKKVVVIDE